MLVLAVAILIFCAGGYIGQTSYEPQVIVEREIHTTYKVVESVVYKPIDRVIENIVYQPVDRVKENVVFRPIEKVIIRHVETAKPLQHFQNIEELEQWIKNVGVLDIRFDVAEKETSRVIDKFDCGISVDYSKSDFFDVKVFPSK